MSLKDYSLKELQDEIRLRCRGHLVGYGLNLGDDFYDSYVFFKTKEQIRKYVERSRGQFETWMESKIFKVYSKDPEAKHF